MQTNELLTVQQFADAAGISKQAVYKALNNKLKPFVQLVDGKKMIQRKALQKVYEVEVDQPSAQPNENLSKPMETLITMLQKELEEKNAQLEAKDRQIEQLMSALQAEQALHAGTLQKQLPVPKENDTTGQEKKKWYKLFARKDT